MKFISHRGNIDGKNKQTENHPKQILKAISLGYDVEIDIWDVDCKLWLGHDGPEYETTESFLLDHQQQLLIHCKNDAALFKLHSVPKLNIFTHADDPFTISSKNDLLIHPHTKTTCRRGILIMPEMSHYTVDEILQFDGIVSDNIEFYYFGGVPNPKFTHTSY